MTFSSRRKSEYNKKLGCRKQILRERQCLDAALQPLQPYHVGPRDAVS